MDGTPLGPARITPAQFAQASPGLQPVSPTRSVERQGQENAQPAIEQNGRLADVPAAEVTLSSEALEQARASEASTSRAANRELEEVDVAETVQAARSGVASDAANRVGRDANQSGRAAFVQLGGEARQLARVAQRQVDVGRTGSTETEGREPQEDGAALDVGAHASGVVRDDLGETRDAGRPPN